MTPHAKAAIIVALHLLLAFDAPARAAESVFRCGNSYSQVPCVQGQVVDVDDSRSDGQRAAAREVAAREARLAAQMTRDRERSETGTVVVSTVKALRTKTRTAGAVPAAMPTRRGKGKVRDMEGKDFVAFAPKPAKQSAAKK